MQPNIGLGLKTPPRDWTCGVLDNSTYPEMCPSHRGFTDCVELAEYCGAGHDLQMRMFQ